MVLYPSIQISDAFKSYIKKKRASIFSFNSREASPDTLEGLKHHRNRTRLHKYKNGIIGLWNRFDDLKPKKFVKSNRLMNIGNIDIGRDRLQIKIFFFCRNAF